MPPDDDDNDESDHHAKLGCRVNGDINPYCVQASPHLDGGMVDPLERLLLHVLSYLILSL